METLLKIGIAIDAAALVAIFIYAPIANYISTKNRKVIS